MTKESAKRQFKELQYELVQIILDIAIFKGRSQKASIISGFLYLGDSFTQDELKKLTKLSLGTISNTLNSFIDAGFVEKKKQIDPQSGKPKFHYFSKSGSLYKDYTRLQNESMALVPQLLQRLQNLQLKLDNPVLHDKSGHSEMINFTKNMQLYLMRKPQIPYAIKSKTFSDEIINLEKEFLEYLTNFLIKFSGRDPIFAKSIGYFFTRQKLTQNQLKHLTGLSAGAISKIVNFFTELRLVKKEIIPGTHQFIYTMKGISFGTLEYNNKMKSKFREIDVQLDIISTKIENNISKFQNFDGFSNTLQLIEDLKKMVNIALSIEIPTQNS